MLRRRIPIAVLLLVALAAGAMLLTPVTGAQDVGKLRQRADAKRASERALSADVARLGRLLRRLRNDIAVVERRRAQVRAELATDQAKLGSLRADLRDQRARVQRLKAHLRESQGVLSRRLVELYKAPDPDLLSVVLSANDFSDLLDRATFLQRIQSQDQRIITNVVRARSDANAAVQRLAKAEAAQQETTQAIATRCKALAGISAALASRQRRLHGGAGGPHRGAEQRAHEPQEPRGADREARSAARELRGPELRRARGRSRGRSCSASRAGRTRPPTARAHRATTRSSPPPGGSSGAAAPAAYLAPKAEQDRVAARIWNGGAGASNWDCAALVAY